MPVINTVELNVVQRMLGLRTPVSTDAFKNIAFVCVDCEAHEFAQDKITEIGISVLDMSTIGQPLELSAFKAEDFIRRMQYAHYRIIEHGQLVNKRWVKGYPENFTFGNSVWINRANARFVLGCVLNDPASLSTAHLSSEATESVKKVVIVGHSMTNDARYLKHLDFDLKALPNVVRTVDTQRIAGSKKRSVGLSTLLKALGLDDTQHLHNAGNDAAYTMHALILMAVKEFYEPNSVSNALAEQQPNPIDAGDSRPNRRERKRLMRLQQQEEARQIATGEKEGDESKADITLNGVEPALSKIP